MGIVRIGVRTLCLEETIAWKTTTTTRVAWPVNNICYQATQDSQVKLITSFDILQSCILES